MKFFCRIEVDELMYACGHMVLHLALCHLVPGEGCCTTVVIGCGGCYKDVIENTDQVCFLRSLTTQQI